MGGLFCRGVTKGLDLIKVATGILRLDPFESVVFFPPNKKPTPFGVGFVCKRSCKSTNQPL